MKRHVLHTVWCNISGEAAGEIWKWSLLGVKGLKLDLAAAHQEKRPGHPASLQGRPIERLQPLDDVIIVEAFHYSHAATR